MTNEILSERIVNKVLRDLHGRKGVGNALDMIESDIYDEMEMELRAKVLQILNGQS